MPSHFPRLPSLRLACAGAAALLLAGPDAARAAEALSWQACIELARSNNAGIRAADAEVESLENQAGGARSGFFPQLSADLNYNRSSTSSVGFTTASTGVVQSGSGYNASLSARLGVFNGLADLGRTRQAEANARAARAAARLARAQASYQLKSAYEGLLFAKEYAKLTRAIIARREENLRLVELRFESGRENKGSALLSRAYRDQARYDDLQARNAGRIARAQLAQVLGLDRDEGSVGDPLGDRDIAEPIPAAAPPAETPDFPSLARQSPDYAQAVAREEAAQAAVTVARAGFFPTLSFTGSTGKQGPDFFPDATDRWTIGATLSFPLFNGGSDYYATRAAIASRSRAEANTLGASRDLIARLEQAYAGYLEAVSRLVADSSFRDASMVRAEIARTKYNNGLLTFEDWDIIENDQISRQKAFLQSRRDRLVAEAAWEQAQGTGAIR